MKLGLKSTEYEYKNKKNWCGFILKLRMHSKNIEKDIFDLWIWPS